MLNCRPAEQRDSTGFNSVCSSRASLDSVFDIVVREGFDGPRIESRW
jgi:hypothetical protein